MISLKAPEFEERPPVNTFYIEAVENGSITLSKVGSPTVGVCTYGVDNPYRLSNYTYGSSIPLTAGQKCYFKITETSTNFSEYNYLKFTATNKINVGGTISDLIGGETQRLMRDVARVPRNNCFEKLFYQCTKLIDASNLVLDVTISKSQTYGNMFYGCSNLTTHPVFLYDVGEHYTCYHMFEKCSSLTLLPELSDRSLGVGSYQSMFNGCTSIKLSETQTGNYTKPYRIPTEGTGTVATDSLSSMFANTGGTFTGTPTINTTYYLWED